MKDEMEKVLGKHHDLNEIFAFVYALKILDDYSTFKRYLASFKTIPRKNVFNGFLFLIKTIRAREELIIVLRLFASLVVVFEYLIKNNFTRTTNS